MPQIIEMNDTPLTNEVVRHYGCDFYAILRHAWDLERECLKAKLNVYAPNLLLQKEVDRLTRELEEVKRGKIEPTSEQVGAAVMAFQDSTKHVRLNITTAQFVLAMVAALTAAANVGGNDGLPSDKTE